MASVRDSGGYEMKQKEVICMNLTQQDKEQAIIDVWRKAASAMLVDGPNVDDAFDEIKRIVNGESYQGTPVPNIVVKGDFGDPDIYRDAYIRRDDQLSEIMNEPMVMISGKSFTISVKASDVIRIFGDREVN